MSLQETNGALQQLRDERVRIHDELANVWMSLQRPITPAAQNESLQTLTNAMQSIRQMDETITIVALGFKRADSDLLQIGELIRKVRSAS